MPRHTGGAVLGDALFELEKAGLITLTKRTDNDIGTKLSSTGGGYAAAGMLSGEEANTVVKITSHFSELQQVLHFSVSDLLKLEGSYATKVSPIFGEPDASLKADIFVLMPFKPPMSPVYEDHIKHVCQLAGLSCKRADDFFGASQIIHDVWSAIFSCRCIVADCTDRNPNVFYEIGIAHTLGKPVVLITQREEDVPFDIRHMRFIKYDYTPRGMKDFESNLKSMLLTELQLKK